VKQERKPNMPANQPITAETIGAMASQSLDLPLKASDTQATADLLNALAADMQALRKLPLGDEEPATTYAAVEALP
jgi:hypothetical protein